MTRFDLGRTGTILPAMSTIPTKNRLAAALLALALAFGANAAYAAETETDPDMDTEEPDPETFGAVPLPERMPDGGGEVLPGAPVEEDMAEEAAPAPKTRAERLDALFAGLKAAKTDDEAKKTASRIAEMMLQSGSATIDLLMARALVSVHAKDYALALDLLDAVVRLKPDFVEGWNKRATVHFLRRDYARSLADIHRTLEMEPRHFGAINGLAVILENLDNEERALDAYKRLIEIYPRNEQALKEIRELSGKAEGRQI